MRTLQEQVNEIEAAQALIIKAGNNTLGAISALITRIEDLENKVEMLEYQSSAPKVNQK